MYACEIETKEKWKITRDKKINKKKIHVTTTYAL